MLNECEVSSSFATFSPMIFPKFATKFRGPKWNLEVARDQLMSIMQVHGFCIGGPKKYRNPADKPSGWPSTINFEEVKHPCYLKLDQINTIIESILGHHGIDPYTHHGKEDCVTRKPQAKRAKKTTSNEFIDRDEEETVTISMEAIQEHALFPEDTVAISMQTIQDHTLIPVIAESDTTMNDNGQVIIPFSEM